MIRVSLIHWAILILSLFIPNANRFVDIDQPYAIARPNYINRFVLLSQGQSNAIANELDSFRPSRLQVSFACIEAR